RDSNFEATVQSLSSGTRALITRESRPGVNTERSLRFQSRGDQAFRHGDLIRAAEEYGRAEEAATALDTERVHAESARSRTIREIKTARRKGTDVAEAETKDQHGDQVLVDGDFVKAELFFAEARGSVE